jgi:hypothetical protein
MNDHSSLLILGGVVVALAPFLLIGIGIARDYRAAHPNRPYEPHNARNIVLGFAVAIVASVMFGWLSHPSRAPTLGPVRTDSANGVPFVPLPTSVAAAAPRAASAGASAATSPRSTTTTFAVHGSGLTAFVSTLAKGTTLMTAPTVPPGTLVVTTAKPPTTTATTKSTVATTATTRGATTSTTLPRSTTTMPPTTTTVARTTTTVPATTTTATTVPVTTTTATTVPVTTTTATTVPVTTTTGAP